MEKGVRQNWVCSCAHSLVLSLGWLLLSDWASSADKESACNAGDPNLIPGSGRFSGEGIGHPLQYSRASLAAQLVDLGLIPGLGRSPGGGYDNSLHCSCLDDPHGQRSLADCGPRDSKSQRGPSDRTAPLSDHRDLSLDGARVQPSE